MQDVQPVIKQSSIMTPSNNLKGRNQDFRNQMELERASMQGQSPYTSELFGSYLRNDTSNDDIWSIKILLVWLFFAFISFFVLSLNMLFLIVNFINNFLNFF